MRFSQFFCLFMLMVVVVSSFSVGFSFGYDSELNGYDFYKIIAYEAGVGAGVDYQVVVVVHYGSGTDGTMSLNGETVALVHVGDIQADFDDVRFANQFGEVLMHKRCDYVSAVNATFVVKVEADLDVDQLVYLYYANPVAVDASSDNALIDVVVNVVLALPMLESGATEPQDYSGNNLDGSRTGGTAYVAGKFKNCIDLDGVDGKVTVLDNALLDVVNVTAMLWFKRDTALFATRNTLINKQFSAFQFGGETATDDVAVYFTAGGNFLFANDAVVTNQDVWYHETFRYPNSANKGEILLNGTSVSLSVADGGNLGVNANDILIGENVGFFDGKVSDILIFNTSLTDPQISNIASNYGDPTLVAGSVLVRKWASTTLPAVADISEQVSNVEVTPSPSVVPISEGELSNAMLFVLGFMVVLCVVGLVWLSRVPVVVLLVGLFAVLVGLYCVLGGVYGLGVGQGWFALFTVVFGGLTMFLVGLGVRVRR